MDKTGTKVLRFSVEGQMVLSICPQRQIFRPVRRNRHEPAGFLQRTLSNWHFNDDFWKIISPTKLFDSSVCIMQQNLAMMTMMLTVLQQN